MIIMSHKLIVVKLDYLHVGGVPTTKVDYRRINPTSAELLSPNLPHGLHSLNLAWCKRRPALSVNDWLARGSITS